MATYKAPLREMRFLLGELLDVASLTQLPGYGEATSDVIDAILEEGAKFCENELLPLNRSGDEEGCVFENGVVRTPQGFKEAYRKFAEGGWVSLSCAPEYGGQGLPKVINLAVEEMVNSSNMSFGMYPGLSLGAYNAIAVNASDALKRLYLPKLTSGEWSGTMCLTEPQCGTDLGLVRTRAEPDGAGAYKITGTKIFISAGEHDLADNIIHLVLARLPGAPSGTRGISLFLVPKFLPREDGSAGPRNGVACGAIEHKMGIRASSTCVINFDEATGWLVGGENQGMRGMFVMMNAARLGVGVQGMSLGETAYQSAVAYARERLAGRSLAGAKYPDKPADPIIVHPDIRKMLLRMRSQVEPARALAYWIGVELDKAERHPDPLTREAADDLVALMTPIIKAYFTDLGFEAANLAVQTYGGHGYIREHGVEQLVRDARITQLYEGTNGIQALDLVGRKLGLHMGRLLRRFFHPVLAFVEKHQANPKMGEFVLPLAKALARLQQVTGWLAEQGLRDPEEAGAAASDYLRLFGLVALAFMWCRMVEASLAKLGNGAKGQSAANGESDFYDAKLATARFYMARVLPEANTLFQSIMAGKKPLMELAEAAF